ncbi:MAG: LytR C-terminal domain-containing protein [Gemmatimonadota bacterium]
MGRTRRREPIWPLGLMLAVVAAGLGIGGLFPGVLGRGDGSGLVENLAEDGAVPAPGARVRVEVLNGGGVQGMAGRATELLRDDGFDVVYFGNAQSVARGGSVVLARTSNRDAAAEVAAALGIGMVRLEPDSTLLVDVTVLLGSEWAPAEER